MYAGDLFKAISKLDINISNSIFILISFDRLDFGFVYVIYVHI